MVRILLVLLNLLTARGPGRPVLAGWGRPHPGWPG